MGGDSKAVRILLDNGQVSEVPLEDAVAVEFTAAQARAPPPHAAPNPRRGAQARRQAVRSRGHRAERPAHAGDRRRCLAGRHEVQGDRGRPGHDRRPIVIPRGAAAVLQAVHVEQSGKMKGSDKISLKLNSIGFGGRVYEVATTYVDPRARERARRPRARSAAAPALAPLSAGSPAAGRGGHRRGRWRSDRRRRVQRRRRTSEGAGRDATAVPAHRRGQHSALRARIPAAQDR